MLPWVSVSWHKLWWHCEHLLAKTNSSMQGTWTLHCRGYIKLATMQHPLSTITCQCSSSST